MALMIGFASYCPINAEDNRGIKAVSKSGLSGVSRMALVIGNSSYNNAPLKNPVNDAKDIATTLRLLGFEVMLFTDAEYDRMNDAIYEFGEKLKRRKGIGLFFFAGHGMQVKGRNYLIPVGRNIQKEYQVRTRAVDVGEVLAMMEDAGNPMNMVLLDACRNNPFARSFRSASRGLAQIDAPKGSLIVYATAPGSVAADGEGRNGVFTKHLLQHMSQPNLDVVLMLRKARVGVLRETANKQTPWSSSSLEGAFYFNPTGRISVTDAPSPITYEDPPPLPVKLLGYIQVNVNQPNSKIYINGEYAGQASPGNPLNDRNVVVGMIEVKVKSKGCQSKTQRVTVKAGKWSQLVYVLKKTDSLKQSSTMRRGLVAYYSFNGNAKDESGNGNHGKIKGATLTSDRKGNPNSQIDEMQDL